MTNIPDMTLMPIGMIRSPLKTPLPSLTADDLDAAARMERIKCFRKELKTVLSEIVVFPEYEELLYGIEGYSHVLVLFWPHLQTPDKRAVRRVHPMGRKDVPMQGVFATCSPARPNPILVSAVQLIERSGTVLHVKGLDAVDGSPLIDIKPYIAGYHHVLKPRIPEWMRRLNKELEND